MTTKTVKLERTIVIEQDSDPMNPRVGYDNVGIMACWHSRYNLGDVEQTDSRGVYIDNTDGPYEFRQALENALNDIMWKRRPALKAQNYSADDAEVPCPRGCSEPDSAGMREESECPHCSGWGMADNPFWIGDGPADYATALEKYDEYEHLVSPDNRLIYLPLNLLDHSGISMSTGRFSCPWDSGQVGWIFCTGATAVKEWGKTRLTKKAVESARRYLEAEVETYDQYLTGQVYGFTIYEHVEGYSPEDGEQIDSCWGFFSDDYGSDWKEMGMVNHWPDDWETYRIVVNGEEEQEWREAA
jgi:hypothetical protein